MEIARQYRGKEKKRKMSGGIAIRVVEKRKVKMRLRQHKKKNRARDVSLAAIRPKDIDTSAGVSGGKTAFSECGDSKETRS